MKLKKGDIVELEIKKIVFGGEGLGYYNDEFAVFVPNSVPGDVVRIEIISTKKSYARGLIIELITPSSDRKNSLISFEELDGCDFGMMKYTAQLKYKELMVKEVLERIGKNSNVKIEPILESPMVENYRNKIVEPFSYQNGKIITGFYKRKSHNIFEVENNILNSKLGNRVIKRLKELLNENRVSVYDERVHKGILRHIMVKTNSYNQAMVVLIINEKTVSSNLKEMLSKLKKDIPEIVSVYVSYNTKKTNVAMGERTELLFGEKVLKEKIGEIEFNISPTSFFQINQSQVGRLYTEAINMFEDIESKNIVDAYSGTGTLAMLLSNRAKKIYSIEIIKSAIEDGKRTAKENGIKNIEFICGDVTKEMERLIKREQIDAIMFDPPRKGIEEKTLIEISQIGVKEIVYISCNPSTFARDIEVLERLGYRLERVKPVDMFPQTSHIEVIGKLKKIGD